MLDEVVSVLACPHCQAPLKELTGTLSCSNGHSFDIARQGYANLLSAGAHTGTADSREMVAARAEFLSGESFAPLTAAVAKMSAALLAECTPGIVIDAGAGTGNYLAAVLDASPLRTGLALDISKNAARVAARAHPRASAVVADSWGRLPASDCSAALVLAIFAPKNAREFSRVLAPGGALLVVTPTVRHQVELVDALGLLNVDPDKDVRLHRTLGSHFAQHEAQLVEYVATLSRDEALLAAQMGPTAAHVTAEDLRERCDRLPDALEMTISAQLAVYEPHDEAA